MSVLLVFMSMLCIALFALFCAVFRKLVGLQRVIQRRRDVVTRSRFSPAKMRTLVDRMSELLDRMEELDNTIRNAAIDDGKMGHSYRLAYMGADGQESSIVVRSAGSVSAMASEERALVADELANAVLKLQVY